MPKVSIIMNCYNSDQYLKEAIDSIYSQTFTDWEIIFWDNQSTDKSAEIAKSYDEKLKYFYAEEFLPLGAARNKALQKAQGEFVAFLDCDDLWLPEKLEMQIEAFKINPGIDFVYTNSYVKNEMFNTLKVAYRDLKPEGDVLEGQLKNYSVSIPTVIFHRDLLNKVDYWFDINYNIIEEYDLFIRMFVYARVKYIPAPLTIYRVHGNNTTGQNKKRWIEEMICAINTFSKIDKIMEKVDQSWKAELEYAIYRNQVIYYLEIGENRLARKSINGISSKDKLAPIYYFISLLPKRISMPVYRTLARIYTKKTIYD